MTPEFVVLTLACAALTFAARAGGYVVLSRFRAIPPRLAAALNAVPAAVMTTMVAPTFFSGHWREVAALLVAVALGLRFGLMVTMFGATAFLAVLRHLG